MATSGGAAQAATSTLTQLPHPTNKGVETADAAADASDAATGCDSSTATSTDTLQPEVQPIEADTHMQVAMVATLPATTATALNKKLLLCRRFKDSGGILRNFNSLPLFVYATSSSTRATSADGVGVSKDAAAAAAGIAAIKKNDAYDLANNTGFGAMDCLPLGGNVGTHHHHTMSNSNSNAAGGVGTPGGVSSYQHHLNLNHHHPHLLLHSPYSNNYPLHHGVGNSSGGSGGGIVVHHSHHNLHSEQTKSLQELQHEVGALLEFRDLVIETFPDLKHKMASISSSASSATVGGGGGGGASVNASVSGTNTLTGSSLASRREWEPGIRIKRKLSQKEPSTSSSSSATAAVGTGASATSIAVAAGELSSSSLTRSRSNSHSGKKEPKSGENNNGSVVQDSGFSTETSSSKEGHSASSTNGAMTGAIASNRLSCPESDDELLNLLDVIHRKSNRLREEVEHLQNYERQNLQTSKANEDSLTLAASEAGGATALTKSSSASGSSSTTATGGLTPKTFREHVERLNKEDIKQLRKERDRLLDKLAEMEAETLTGRIKAAKMSDKVEELISVKKDLEEQLKLAMAQKLELSSRVQQMQLQQQQQQSKSSSSQSDYSSQRNFLSSAATTVLSNAAETTVPSSAQNRRANTFQPVVVEQEQDAHLAFHHQSANSDSSKQPPLGRLDGIVSTPGARNTKCRTTDSKRFTAILLETNVIELQRHLLTLTVQNQVLMQKLEQSTKSKTHLAKRLDKSKEDVEDLRFQLEEKNIELEGTKAQLRVLESRLHSTTSSSCGAATNSYLHSSQHDYETNRSSASTTLMLSRRGGDSHYSDMRSSTPTSQSAALTAIGQMPPPTATQISTPSMKAMVHLRMDEQHSSSTESAHEHELPQTPTSAVRLLMSTSVGGISPFEQHQQSQLSPRGQHSTPIRKFIPGSAGSATKPSKIPLPGSKAASFFTGKPPTGRPSTAAGRSPPSANTSTGSNVSSSRSSLSRSTGNLLYAKSPNSLKRADSAQSIRKDNNNVFSSSLSTSNTSGASTNTSRSSNASSIPMATTPYSSNYAASKSHTTPSPRMLQNSPLPKLKRESLTSRVRHLDSLSRVHQHSNGSDVSSASPPAAATATTNGSGNGSYFVSSAPKPSSIAAQLNSTLRKDLQLSSSSFTHGSQQFMRRANGGNQTATAAPTANATTRRFSSASVVGARVAAARNQQEHQPNAAAAGGAEQLPNGADSDSGKVRTLKSTFLGWLKI